MWRHVKWEHPAEHNLFELKKEKAERTKTMGEVAQTKLGSPQELHQALGRVYRSKKEPIVHTVTEPIEEQIAKIQSKMQMLGFSSGTGISLHPQIEYRVNFCPNCALNLKDLDIKQIVIRFCPDCGCALHNLDIY